jgi:hypothetical protein
MKYKCLLTLVFILTGFSAHATMDNAQMSVWVNEAIVETYTYQYDDYRERQKVFAHYFTAEAWIAYIKALNESKLLDEVKKNKYLVSAVATMPPTITASVPHHWKAVMPLLVRYKNPQVQQKQFLEVVLDFTEAPSDQGVRGLAITSIQVKKSTPPCPCAK